MTRLVAGEYALGLTTAVFPAARASIRGSMGEEQGASSTGS